MKKPRSGIFLTLLLMSLILSPGNPMAQLLTTSPSSITSSLSAQISSLYYPSISYPFISSLSINSPSISSNIWSMSSPSWNIGQSSFLSGSSYLSPGQLSFPSSSSYLSPSQLNLSWNAPYLETSRSSVPYLETNRSSVPYLETSRSSLSYLETNRSSVPFTFTNSINTNSINSLWYWPTTAPDWGFGLGVLGNQGLNYMTLNSGNVGITTPKPVEVDFNQLWQKVSEAIGKGLPKTAIEHLKTMIPLAIKSEKYGVAMKAICKQIVLEANIQGNKPDEKITRLTEEIEKAPELLKPLLNIVLAQWYWQYYQENRWRFSERDTTANIIDTDFTTWDSRRLFDKIDDLYTKVLAQEEQLKAISMKMFTDFFTSGDVPLSYRPTLFDFVAFSAISFYQDGDQLRKSPEDAFELNADSDAFAPAEVFIQYSPETTDTSSPLLKAMKIYQKLLNFHINDSSKEAFVDADINRLVFINAYSLGEEKSSRYTTHLSEIVENCSIPSLSSLACYNWAQELYNQSDYAQAHKIAKNGAARDAGSYGGKLCQSLLTTIETKELTLNSEYSMTPSSGEVRLDYKNITHVHFRIVADQWKDFLKGPYRSPEYNDDIDNKLKELLQKTPIKSWSVALKPTEDFLRRSQLIDLPSLTPGYYSLIASWRSDFANKENAINIASFWVTEIAMVTKTIGGELECFVLDAHSGVPLEGAKVTVFQQESSGYYQESAVKYTTDKDGSFAISDAISNSNGYQNNMVLHAQYNDYELLSQSFYISGPGSEHGESQQTIFFTDRSIYRPEQTIHFKALAIKSNQARDTYDFLPNTKLTIRLLDRNYREVEHLDVVTNAFGSASGTFTAPSGTLTGKMIISCSKPGGSTNIQVEEYKRPKFKVILDPPQKEGRLDEEIELPGQAMAYSGAPIDEANISYRVTREVRYPYWCWWSRYRSSIAREIAHGKLKTDAEGKFSIRFTGRPDRSIPQSDQPIFTFKVSVDVTDSSGETRSKSRSVQAGYVSMSLNISAGDWLTDEGPVKFDISAMTLDQQPLKTRGTVTVYTLKQPEKPVRSSILGSVAGYLDTIAGSVDTIDESNWETWPEDKVVATSAFDTAESASQISFILEPGAYRVIATAYDRYGKEVKAMLPIMVLDPAARNFTVPIPNLVKVRSATLEVGDTLEALWGTGYQEGHALVEIEHRGKMVKRYWTDSQNTQQKVEWVVGEEHRGGFSLHITQVHDNRAYITTERIAVPWSNKKLDVSFSSFRSKLDPGAEETWTIQIKGPGAENVAAELAATLYDASLDAFLSHNWPGLDGIFRQDYSRLSTSFANRASYPGQICTWNNTYSDYPSRTYTRFPDDVVQNYSSYGSSYGGYSPMSLSYGAYSTKSAMGGMYMAYSAAPSVPSPSGLREASAYLSMTPMADSGNGGNELTTPEEDIDFSQVSTRTNFNETAFFFPHLLTDGQGQVSITFTIPETLTTWKFMGFAHAQNLLWGSLSEEIVTQKDFMVQANPPRFLREGDILLFSAKVTNLSDQEQSGIIRLSLSDTLSEQSLDKEFLNGLTDQSFSVPARSSRSFSWEITVPDYSGVLTYKVVASTGQLSDGEEDALPVLSRRIFVTESLPLPIRGAQTKTFNFTKLLESYQSETLEHQALTLQMTSNPAWYAVQSLPYLMESTYECSERVFSQLYANAIARHIANSDPKIKDVFSLWEGTEALKSNLEKNEELKSVLLEETPWVRAAERESESKKRIGLLFDDDQVEKSLSSAYDKLAKMQLADGSWPWFPGGRSNFYITLHIMTGFGRLRHMGIDVKQDLAIKCLNYVDHKMYEAYEEIGRRGSLDQDNLSSTVALYLYGRSFYLDTHPIPGEYQAAVDYFLAQASQYWLNLTSRLSQGHLALACERFHDQVTAQDIMASLKERSVSDEEMGMFWRDLELSWWWHKAPIETQAVMIEAFDEVSHDQTAVEDLKVWLLKQKQTQNWKTTKSTADAVYALLLRGENLLASDELVKVTLGNLEIVPENVEAGTGFYEEKFSREEVKADYGQITIKKVDEGIAWGSLHWQYLEDISKVTPHETPLQLEKTLYVERQSKEGPVIEPVTGDLAVGDLITVRIILRVDRDMEYVHLKDGRGSGTEPVNVLSQYKYQDGLAYYESTRDTATNFFIDYLPKGTYVFEYPVRIQHRGEYQMGIATIQCMYAPEFNSHSASQLITVR